MRCLPTDVLRSFAAIVEAGSMKKASERECLTQSALSLRLSRLEDVVQRQLFFRDGGRLTLTPAGQILLAYARRMLDLNDRAIAAMSSHDFSRPIRVGMMQIFAETVLTGVLARFSQLHPEAVLQLRVAPTTDLLSQLDAGQVDIAIGIGAADHPSAVRRASMLWIGDSRLADHEIVPLAMLESPCQFRDAALAALDEAGRPYRIVLETPNLSTLRAGVDAGLGLTCRTELFGQTRSANFLPLPPLPQVSCIVAIRPDPPQVIGDLVQLIRDSLA
jgi:DNA-binding transcriptional LysR family regulator